MPDRNALRTQMEKDGIEYLLVQFVDITGAAKVKMVPVGAFDAAIDDGAGFAGGAVWGVGRGPHSHDMLARIDLAKSPCPITYASPLTISVATARKGIGSASKSSIFATLVVSSRRIRSSF